MQMAASTRIFVILPYRHHFPAVTGIFLICTVIVMDSNQIDSFFKTTNYFILDVFTILVIMARICLFKIMLIEIYNFEHSIGSKFGLLSNAHIFGTLVSTVVTKIRPMSLIMLHMKYENSCIRCLLICKLTFFQ